MQFSVTQKHIDKALSAKVKDDSTHECVVAQALKHLDPKVSVGFMTVHTKGNKYRLEEACTLYIRSFMDGETVQPATFNMELE